MSGMFFGRGGHSHGGHGHSHKHGEECGGHHGAHEMSEEMRQKLMKQLEERMQAMQAQGHGHSHSPPGSHPEDDPMTATYSPCLYGYGHELSNPSPGWDVLAKASSMVSANAGNNFKAADGSLIPVKDNFWLVPLPIFGRLRVVKDQQGWMMASAVVFYWIYGNWSTWNTILIPYYYDGSMNLIFLLMYAFVSVMCIGSFFRASTLNPGSLPTAETPKEDWTDCKTCLMKRPPLCHHCRRCGQCVRKMDHHCPWINNCVGEENHFAFILLLIYACLLSVYTLVLQAIHFFWLGGCITCDQESFMIRHQTVIIVVCLVMAVLMLFSMTGLYFTQHISVVHETTTIEWMKIQQQVFATGVIPEKIPEQTKGCCQTYARLCGSDRFYLWLFPCRRRLQKDRKMSVV